MHRRRYRNDCEIFANKFKKCVFHNLGKWLHISTVTVSKKISLSLSSLSLYIYIYIIYVYIYIIYIYIYINKFPLLPQKVYSTLYSGDSWSVLKIFEVFNKMVIERNVINKKIFTKLYFKIRVIGKNIP